MMKYSSQLLGLCVVLAALAVGSVLSGCKDTAPSPTFVDFGSIRVMEFVQGSTVPSIGFVGYAKDNISDTVLRTPTPTTYGVATPYVNNLSTNRGSGRVYHLQAINTSNGSIIKETDVTLLPGDKYTWVVFEPDASGNFGGNLINDNATTNTSGSMAYFRLMNVNPNGAQNPEHLRVGDPVAGQELTPSAGIGFKGISDYAGLATAFDTTVTFYITTDNGTILGRLAGVSLSAGTYHTLVWGGQLDNNARTTDLNGNHIPDDSLRIHMFDDNLAGNDILPVPVTLRYNFVNALVPPVGGGNAEYIDYAQSGGLSVVINNNTVYDYQGLAPFSAVPFLSADGPVLNVIPKSIPYTGLAYFKLVQPINQAQPSSADPILFRFYATTQRIITDQLVSIVVFDTVHSSVKALKAAPPFDSSRGVVTLQIPDQSWADSITIIGANALNGYRSTSSNLSAKMTVNGVSMDKIKGPGTNDMVTIGAGGSAQITVESTINTTEAIPSFSFTAQAGGIYEVLLVGERNRPDGDTRYLPHYMVIRTNPIR